MSPRVLPALLLLACGCGRPVFALGGFEVAIDRDAGSFDARHASGGALLDARVLSGTGSVEVSTAFGAYLFEDEVLDLRPAARIDVSAAADGVLVLALQDEAGAPLGDLALLGAGLDRLVLDFTPADGAANRVAIEAAAEPGEPFLGLGGHAMDVDHAGQAFPLWVSEPGIGKVEDEEPPAQWSLTGTRHASSYPVPFLLRPAEPLGLLAESDARMEADLGAADPSRFRLTTWEGAVRWDLLAGETPLGIVQDLTALTGRVAQPPAWVFGPWNDTILGAERVREVAATLRAAGAPSSVIWTEDWKGGEEGPTGYHLSGEWFLDEDLYPEAPALDAELEAQGLKWLAYFSPFVAQGTATWDEAEAAGALVRDATGAPYTFLGVTLADTSLVDLSSEAARAWAAERMEAALALGFDGWMADYGEWLPLDAVLASGEDPWLAHDRYPVDWQALNREVLDGRDAVFLSRSGWLGTQGLAPVVWGGDQRTSFDPDDGLPTVVALGLGLAASGVPIFGHDVAGYQSVGNDPSDRELWTRWAALGAWSPVLRTHHGAFHDESWQFDRDSETLAFWAALCREQVRLFPYRWGLARRAAEEGTPMLLPPALLFPGDDWGRLDAWMLGDAFFVAPVLERGVAGREVALPPGARWYRWDDRSPAESGWYDAAPGEIPVFVAAGTTVPTLAEIPDTLVDGADEAWTTLAEVDDARVVYLFGGGGSFTEGDGTTYACSGTPTGPAEVEVVLQDGVAEVGGVAVRIAGPSERSYRLVVVP